MLEMVLQLEITCQPLGGFHGSRRSFILAQSIFGRPWLPILRLSHTKMRGARTTSSPHQQTSIGPSRVSRVQVRGIQSFKNLSTQPLQDLAIVPFQIDPENL